MKQLVSSVAISLYRKGLFMKRSATHYYVLVLGNLLFWIPIIFIFINKELSESYGYLLDIIPLYIMFISFMLMVFKLKKEKHDIDYVFSEATGIIKLLMNYYGLVIKEQKITIIWLLFWICLIFSFAQTLLFLIN